MTRRIYLPLSRRTFVKLAAAGAASTALPGCDGTPEAEEVENLIIGSGFGGSITAHRLAEAGHSSVLLERGQRWVAGPNGEDVFSDMGFTEGDAYDKRSAWLAHSQPLPGIPPGRPLELYTGVLERIYGEGIDVVCPAGVGGGSLVYSGMMVRPPQDLFEDVFPAEITHDVMTPYYERVAAMMNPSPIPDSLIERPEWIASKTFIDQAVAAGIEVERVLCAFDWERAEMEARGELPPQLIRGHYIFGLNNGAKRSLDRVYLGLAEDSGLCEVRPLHWVQRIVQSTSGWRVEVDQIDTDGAVVSSRVISARRLFVCAGTMNTTGLLQRARVERTIEGLPESLGEGFGNNGQHIRARRDVGVNTGAFQAGPACLIMFDREAPIAMENGPAPLGFEMQALIGTGQGVPTSFGRIDWDEATGKVVPHWDAANDAGAAANTTALIARLPGVDATRSFQLEDPITFHPLGGCVMGQTTDLYGRVQGHEGLYVIDGALIPGVTPLSNPCWTISANAERCIERILAEDFTGETA